jgi:hypothetical protein
MPQRPILDFTPLVLVCGLILLAAALVDALTSITCIIIGALM